MKSAQARSVFWSVFSRIRIKYGEYRLSLRSQSEYRKMRIRKKLRIWTLFTQCIKHILYTYVYDIYIYISYHMHFFTYGSSDTKKREILYEHLVDSTLKIVFKIMW